MEFREPEKHIFLGSRMSTVHVKPPTLDSHNFFVRTSIRVFLDYTENPLSLESGHMPVNGI